MPFVLAAVEAPAATSVIAGAPEVVEAGVVVVAAALEVEACELASVRT
jgi:hypothetical protein